MKKSNKKFIVLFLISLTGFAFAMEEWIPPYCQKEADASFNNTKCVKPEVSLPDQQKYQGLLSLSNKIVADEINTNLKNIALLDLLEKKKNLIAMYPEIDPQDANSKFPWHKRKEFSKNSDGKWDRKYALSGNHNKCFSDNNNALNEKAKALGDEIPKIRAEFTKVTETTIPLKMKGGEIYNLKAKSTKKSIHMANVLLGALTAEKQIKERPVLVKNIEETTERIAKLEAISQVKPGYENSSSCIGHQGRNNADKCAAAKNPETLQKFNNELSEKQSALAKLKFQKSVTDEAVFKNPYYADPASAIDSTGNWFSNLFKSEEDKKIMGDFKPSPVITKGVSALKKALNNRYGDNTVDDLFKTLSSPPVDEENPSALAAVAIEELLISNPDLYRYMDNLIQDEVVKNLEEVDESLEEICDHGEDILYRIPSMVSKAEKLYLNLAGDKLQSNETLDPYLKAHQDAHCSLIENKDKEKAFQYWMKENGGKNAMLYTQIAGGVTLLGSYVAAGMGCAPCLYYAVGATAAFVGVGAADTMEKDSEADVLTGLSQIGLADHDEAREMLTEARLGWGLLGFDLLTAPFGLKAGQMIKVGKLVKKGTSSLGKSELSKNKDLFKSLVHGLPEEDYLKVVEAIKKLSPEQKTALSNELLSRGNNLSEVERFNFIEQALKKYEINLPSYKELNGVVLQSLENDPQKLVALKVKYSDYLKKTGVTPGSPEEAAELRILGIIESEGCASGVCSKPLMSVEETVAKTKKIKKENGCG